MSTVTVYFESNRASNLVIFKKGDSFKKVYGSDKTLDGVVNLHSKKAVQDVFNYVKSLIENRPSNLFDTIETEELPKFQSYRMDYIETNYDEEKEASQPESIISDYKIYENDAFQYAFYGTLIKLLSYNEDTHEMIAL